VRLTPIKRKRKRREQQAKEPAQDPESGRFAVLLNSCCWAGWARPAGAALVSVNKYKEYTRRI